MPGSLEDSVGQPPTYASPGDGHGRRRAPGVAPSWTHLLVAAVASRHVAVAGTIAGTVAVMVLYVLYAVVVQGWGSPLP